MTDATEVFEDLRAESEELDRLVAELPEERWRQPTPAPGWRIAHQIGHLLWTDDAALLAVRDEMAFRRVVEQVLAVSDVTVSGGAVDEGAETYAALPPAELLRRWRDTRGQLGRELAGLPDGRRVPWFGPPMGAAAMATARLMETWAHGTDVADALGVRREPTARLRHVAWIGVRARDWAYAVHGLEPPGEPFRVELTPPRGGDDGANHDAATARWSYGPPDARQRVTGPALDFCLLATQRTHRADTALRAEGVEAERWLGLVQAFAGPPGDGRKPRSGAGADGAVGKGR